MKKKIKQNFLNFVIFFVFSLTVFMCFAEEEVIFTSYYPAPFGIYSQLKSVYFSVGQEFANTTQYCWGSGCPDTIDENTSMIVFGRAAIGHYNATSTLDIVWSPLNPPNYPYFGNQVGSWAEIIRLNATPASANENVSITFPNANALIGFGVNPRGFYIVDEVPFEHTELWVDMDQNVTHVSSLNVSKLGINVYGAPTSNFQVNGTSNTCVRRSYTVTSGDTLCPDGYHVTVPGQVVDDAYSETSYSAPYSFAKAGVFTCCRVCPNSVSSSGDGSCGS
jgi:hypothetical protein